MKNELLAPAGNLEAVKVAILNGADAVYCAGKKFGARAFIANLSEEEIIEASKFVHLHGKRIYITLNTLVFEDELEEAFKYIDFLYQYVDAIIVQDYGIVHYIRSKYPDFPVHISTQASIHNADDVKFLKSLGVDRIVLAREVNKEEIKAFNELGVELEIFIHGALCFSYSGMCYLSYYKGGRSGNRGNCAQPCRQNYLLLEDGKPIKEGPLLSMKDLNTIDNIKELLNLGVASLKIEGRAKSLEYLASVVRIYRKLIDDYNKGINPKVSKEMLIDLYTSFSRERTKGYLFLETNKDVTVDKSVKHTGVLIGRVIATYKNQIKIKLNETLEINDGIRIIDGNKEVGSIVTRIIEDGKMVKSSSATVIIDIKDKISPNALVYKTLSSKVHNNIIPQEYLYKLPATLEINIKQKSIKISVNILNLSIFKAFSYELEVAKTDNKDKTISQFTKLNKLPIYYTHIELHNEDILFIPIPLINEMRNAILEEVKSRLEDNIYRKIIPYILKTNNYSNSKEIDTITINDFNDKSSLISNSKLSASNLAYHLSEIASDSVVSPYFGVSNHMAISFFRHFTNGVIVLSFESTLDNSLSLTDYDHNLGYLIDYYEPLMVSKHCVVSKAKGFTNKKCGSCYKYNYQIKDGKDIYQLRFNDCNMYIKGRNVKRLGDTKLVDVIYK